MLKKHVIRLPRTVVSAASPDAATAVRGCFASRFRAMGKVLPGEISLPVARFAGLSLLKNYPDPDCRCVPDAGSLLNFPMFFLSPRFGRFAVTALSFCRPECVGLSGNTENKNENCKPR